MRGEAMSAMYHLRLPASELAKLRPFHPHDPAAPRDDVVPAHRLPDAAPVAAARRRRPTHHLSGFARA
jgi:hypothetical protein